MECEEGDRLGLVLRLLYVRAYNQGFEDSLLGRSVNSNHGKDTCVAMAYNDIYSLGIPLNNKGDNQMTEQDNTKNDHFQTSDKPELVLGQAPGRKPIVPDTLTTVGNVDCKQEITDIVWGFIVWGLASDSVNYGDKQNGIPVKEAAQAIHQLEQLMAKERTISGDTSDGYHTFNELYEYRMQYNAALFNEWALQKKYKVHKSWRHADDTTEPIFGGGWFIVMAELPTGQISNHYPEKDWDKFQIPVTPVAHAWDGHTPQEALQRLAQLQSKQQEAK